MYTLIRHAVSRKELAAETSTLLLSLLAAEFFYKFHSFTLECVAFLATWCALSYLLSLVRGGRQAATEHGA